MTLTLAQSDAARDIPRMTVLLIEDDPDDQRLVRDYLLDASPDAFSLECVDRLFHGLQRLSAGGISAVLLDLFLPDSQGLDTFLQTHSLFPRVPIVILTGLKDAHLAICAVAEGAQDYLNKEDLSSEILIRALRYSAERKQAEEQLRQAQKMEVIGHLAGGVAHDFNNLLAVILGNSEILQGCALCGDIAPRAVQRIIQAAKSAASVTAQLLALSRCHSAHPVLLDPNEVVTKTAQLLRHLIPESIALDIRTNPHLARIRIDPGQLEQVILNLAVNARDAMPHGGTLSIRTLNADLDVASATSQSLTPGPYVQLAVSDTGIGMDAQTQARIFEPFYTTKSRGTGLGLATVHEIVQHSAGHISVYSQPGHGTTIRVFLPRLAEHKQTAQSTAPVRETQRGTETVLLVEDNADLREVAREFLLKNGYTVLEAASAEDASTLARDHTGPIHLLLTDVVLPAGGGPELAAQLQSLRPETAILYMSGYTDREVAQHGVLDPVTTLLKKPFTKQQLLSAVREVLDARQAEKAAAV